MGRVEKILRKRLSPEEFELAKEIFSQPVSKIRTFIQEKADEVEAV
jgi:hypothetical protein